MERTAQSLPPLIAMAAATDPTPAGVVPPEQESGRARLAAAGSPWQLHRSYWAAMILFAVALAARLLFWRATPDAAWPYTTYLKGDAALWLEYASALKNEADFELGLPIHPPGAAHLLAWLWDGQPSGVPFLRFVWVMLGALTVPLVYVAALRSFGFAVACMSGLAAAFSTGLLILSTSLNSETPYLLLVAASLCLCEDLHPRPRLGRLALWSALQAVACLFRVEHVVFYLLVLAFMAVRPARAKRAWAWRLRANTVAVSLVCFLLPLVVCLLGLAVGWRRTALLPWLLFLFSRAAVTVLFFGYARQGATVIPVVALLGALAAERWILPRLGGARALAIGLLLALLATGLEAFRCAEPPAVRMDGRETGPGDPYPVDIHRTVWIEVGWVLDFGLSRSGDGG